MNSCLFLRCGLRGFCSRPFHAYPHKFVGLNITSTFLHVISSSTATGVIVLMKFKSRSFQFCTSVFHHTLEFFVIRINEENTMKSPGIFGPRFFDCSIFASLCVSMYKTYVSTFLAIHCLALRFVLLSASSKKWNLWNLSMHLTTLYLHQRSSNLQDVSPSSHLKLCLLSWYRQCISVE